MIQNDLRSCKRPNKKLENKMQRTLRKIKQHLDENEYRRMYPTGSRPGLFYTTAKVHKLQNGVGLNELTMRPTISNIGTATYETEKFLNSLLNFPLKVVHNIIDQEFSQLVQQETTKHENNETQPTLQLMVSYSGNQGHKLLSKMKKQLTKTLPGDVNTMISYKSTKLSTKFPVKGKTDFQRENNVVYHSKCPSEGCHENYIGETNRRIVERIQDHNSRDKNSHLLKHACEKGHTHV